MKRFISSIFFLPLLIALAIVFLNMEIISIKSDLSIFWIFKLKDIPIFALLTGFFSLYIIIIWILLKFSDIFSFFEKKKMGNEINKLKAELQDKQGELLESITDDFQKVFDNFKNENEKTLKTLKGENERTLTQIDYDVKIIKEKLDKIKNKSKD